MSTGSDVISSVVVSIKFLSLMMKGFGTIVMILAKG